MTSTVSAGGPVRFWDRGEAGCRLAAVLAGHGRQRDSIVLALPRGGVPVAYEVALVLGLPLDVFLVRKLGVPGHAELTFGAISSGGVRMLNTKLIRRLGISNVVIDRVTAEQQLVLRRREACYRGERPTPTLVGHDVILVSDGLASGATISNAVGALRRRSPASIVVAVPVADSEVWRELQAEADAVVCAFTPEAFHEVSGCYDDFAPVTDDQIRDLLDRSAS